MNPRYPNDRFRLSKKQQRLALDDGASRCYYTRLDASGSQC